MKQAVLRFYAELKDFLAGSSPSGTVVHAFAVPGSVKDVIEGHGVPHTEVDLIVVNGESVDFNYRIADGDLVSVYPVFESFDISPILRVRPEPLRHLKFVLDGHLSRLARYLRLIGFDAVWDQAWTDHQLVAVSTEQRRVLLTRNAGLLKHAAVTHGYFVRSTDPRRQLTEAIRRFHLADRIDPFTRCMSCNGLLEQRPKAAVADRLLDETLRHFENFQVCSGCNQIYWQGSHYDDLVAIVEHARQE